MIKSSYLATRTVQQFVAWLSKNLDSETFAHSYINRRSGSWQCKSLYDAYVKYQWRHRAGDTFADSAATLTSLSSALHAALASPANDQAARSAATDVMTWGGVVAGNVRWLNANRNLTSDLLAVQAAINAQDTADDVLADRKLRFNAGMTKVYSLLCDGLIIYDSRVAATLGWAVRKFCEAQQLTSVPAELSFPWAPAKSTPNNPAPKNRDPSSTALSFPKLTPGPLHAQWNMKASWILEAALLSSAGQTSQFASDPYLDTPALQLRAVEAALFMIGYDLNQQGAVASPRAETAPHVSAMSESWIECETLARRNPFRYRLIPTGFQVEKGPSFTVDEVNETLEILWRHFDSAAFPLANSVDGVPNETVPMGLGTAYYRATRRSAAYASKLAAILEDLNIFRPVQTPRTSGLHWALNRDLLKLDTPATRVDVTPVLKELEADLAEN
ncbi:MAG: hypothetical protein ACRYF8_10235 [Janthinobacterium lividum]